MVGTDKDDDYGTRMRLDLFRSDDDPANGGYWSLTLRGRTWMLDLYRHRLRSQRWFVARGIRHIDLYTRTHVTALAWYRR